MSSITFDRLLGKLVSHWHKAADLSFTPASGITATDAQAAIVEALTDAKAYADTLAAAVGGAVILKGSWNASSGSFPITANRLAGWSWIVSVGGTVDGVTFNANDRIIAIVDNASTTVFAANWFKADYTDQVLSVNGATGVISGLAELTTANIWTAQQTFKELKETVYTITDGAAFEIDPANGTMQKITLTASRTPLATNFESGQSITLKIADGTAYTITWTSILAASAWVGGAFPTLATTGYTVIVLWKDDEGMHGMTVGDIA